MTSEDNICLWQVRVFALDGRVWVDEERAASFEAAVEVVCGRVGLGWRHLRQVSGNTVEARAPGAVRGRTVWKNPRW